MRAKLDESSANLANAAVAKIEAAEQDDAAQNQRRTEITVE